MATDLTKYQSLDLDMLEEADRTVAGIVGGSYFKLEVGDSVLRFLPGPRPGVKPFKVTATHYVDAIPGLDKTVIFSCPRIEAKLPCPACAEADRLRATRNPVDKERARRIESKLEVYFNVLDRRGPQKGPQILRVGLGIWKRLKTIRQNNRTGGDYFDPSAGGFDIIITRVGTGKKDTEYTVEPDRANTALVGTSEELDAIMSGAHNLEAEVDITVPEELLRAWQAMDSVGRGRAEPTPRRSAALDARGESPSVQATARVVEAAPANTDPDDPENW